MKKQKDNSTKIGFDQIVFLVITFIIAETGALMTLYLLNQKLNFSLYSSPLELFVTGSLITLFSLIAALGLIRFDI